MWIKVSEKLPNDKQDILTYWPKRNLIQLQTFYESYGGTGESWFTGNWQNLALADNDVSHWMSLPDPPKNND